MERLTKEEATKFFSDFYGGEHHIPGYTVKPHGYGWAINHDRGELSTFDFNGLTRLVLMAHDQCIRVGIEPVRNRIMRITVFKRQGREGSISERHPTIEQAIEKFRSINEKLKSIT